MLLTLNVSAMTDPLSLWSLWVPLLLLNLIVLAAVYFVRIRIR